MFKQIALIALIASAQAISVRQAPATNHCVNPNKATTVDESCDTAGNSAWNTHTTSRTANPENAQAPPYPDHTLH